MRVGTTFELNAAVVNRAKLLGITDLVFHILDVSLDESELLNFKLHDTSKLTSEGKSYAFKKVKRQVEELEKRNSRLFNYKKYDLKNAIIKDVFWSLIMNNLIEQKCKELIAPGVVIIDLNPKTNRFMDFVKLLLKLLQPVKVCSAYEYTPSLKSKIAIRVNSIASFSFFGKLPEIMGNQNYFYYQSSLAQPKDKIDISSNDVKRPVLQFNTKNRFFSQDLFHFISVLPYSSVRFLNLLLYTKRQQILALSELELLAAQNIRGILVCAGEIEGYGIVTGLAAKQWGVKSFNFMNGTKTSDLINGNTNFDIWFMHDEKMRKILLPISTQQEINLLNIGHLMEDVAKEHCYSGTLDKWKEIMEGKKIIALFSSPTYNVEQIEVENCLLEMLKKNENFLVFVRLHPREKHGLPYTHERMILLPDFKEKSSVALFDLLLCSTIAISFGSTVSLQASWFGIPSVTFEFSEKSVLFYADQIKVHHFNQVKMLEEFILFELQKPQQTFNRSISEKSVAQKMVEILLK